MLLFSFPFLLFKGSQRQESRARENRAQTSDLYVGGTEACPVAPRHQESRGRPSAASLDNSGSVVPVVLVITRMLAVVDRGDLEDPVLGGGALAVAAERGASPLVPVAGLLGLLRLGEGLGGNRPQGQEGQGHGAARVRHCGWLAGCRRVTGQEEGGGASRVESSLVEVGRM